MLRHISIFWSKLENKEFLHAIMTTVELNTRRRNWDIRESSSKIHITNMNVDRS